MLKAIGISQKAMLTHKSYGFEHEQREMSLLSKLIPLLCFQKDFKSHLHATMMK